MSTATQQVSTFLPTESQLAVAYSVCRSMTRAVARNFYYAFMVLPKRKREALCAVYAFMRRCDDISDEPGVSIPERRQKLDTWVEDFHRVQRGGSTDDPILLALSDTQRRYQIPVELLDELALGTGMDLPVIISDDDLSDFPVSALTVRYRTFDELRQYCYRVASVVGLVCIRVFGYRDPRAELLAENVGVAFQLTNIIRDVREDADMGRVYLPEEDLEQFSLSAHDLKKRTDPLKFRALLAMEAGRAREFYMSADELLPLIDEDSQPALWTLVTIYRSLLDKIERANYNVFTGKVRLTTLEKLRILGKGLWRRVA
jgi:15-cis-phytoene synthase